MDRGKHGSCGKHKVLDICLGTTASSILLPEQASQPGTRPGPGASTTEDIPSTGYLITLSPPIPFPCCHSSLEFLQSSQPDTPHCHWMPRKFTTIGRIRSQMG
ncbi:hypothetical protein H1C71_038303 [Ictidomys tridecemlineatus]|nr:hypothetical protein H1C71_038303 [Ictidomys tridecemlineatus]